MKPRNHWWMLEWPSTNGWRLYGMMYDTRAVARGGRAILLNRNRKHAPRRLRVRKVGFIDNLKD